MITYELAVLELSLSLSLFFFLVLSILLLYLTRLILSMELWFFAVMTATSPMRSISRVNIRIHSPRVANRSGHVTKHTSVWKYIYFHED